MILHKRLSSLAELCNEVLLYIPKLVIWPQRNNFAGKGGEQMLAVNYCELYASLLLPGIQKLDDWAFHIC